MKQRKKLNDMRKTQNLKKISTPNSQGNHQHFKRYQNIKYFFSKLSQYLDLLLVKDRRDRKVYISITHFIKTNTYEITDL